MPSYRKDRPAKPSSMPRRAEAREEEGARPRPSFIREPMRPSYQEMGPRPAERGRDWTDFIVPSSERADPNFKYSKIFDIFAPGRRGTSASPPPPRSESREMPARGERPQRGPGQPPSVDPTVWFDMGRIWNAVQTVRQDQRFRPGSPVAVVQIANASRDEEARAQDLVRFFGIPPAEVQRFRGPEIWTRLLTPFLDELAHAITYQKPRDIPGRFKFQTGNDGSFWLAYVE